MSAQAWMVSQDNFAVSFLVVALVAMVFMYAARTPMTACSAPSATRLAGRCAWRHAGCSPRPTTCSSATSRCCSRTGAGGRRARGARVRAPGRDRAEDLQGYPALQRKLLDEITRIEEDYKKCGEVPPPPPEWVEAVAAMANVKTGGNELVLRILEEIKRSIDKIHDKAIGDTAAPTSGGTRSSKASCRSGARSTRTWPGQQELATCRRAPRASTA